MKTSDYEHGTPLKVAAIHIGDKVWSAGHPRKVTEKCEREGNKFTLTFADGSGATWYGNSMLDRAQLKAEATVTNKGVADVVADRDALRLELAASREETRLAMDRCSKLYMERDALKLEITAYQKKGRGNVDRLVTAEATVRELETANAAQAEAIKNLQAQVRLRDNTVRSQSEQLDHYRELFQSISLLLS